LVALAKWEKTLHLRWLIAFSSICGLGLLMKITFPLFVAPVAVFILLRAYWKRPLRLLAIAPFVLAPAAILAGPWYKHNWEAVTQRSFQESYFAPVHPTERQSPLGMAVEYFFIIISDGLSAAHVVAAAAGLIVWLIFRRDNFLRGAWAYVVPWMITFPIFMLSENRDARLVAPMLPALAMVTA